MQKSFPFNSVNKDRLYSADDWRYYFATLLSNGVFPNPSTGLQVVSNNNMTISILEGKGYIHGAIYHNTDNLVLNIDPADGTLNRIDRIVMRFDTLGREITCRVKKGTFASNPIAPTLQRDADYYELCIAEIRVDRGVTSILQSKITDTRLNSEICGIVTQMINTIDTTTLFTKLEAYIDERGQDVNGWIDEATTRWEVEFISWFNTIKDILDGDVAGALAARIAKLEETVNNLELTSTKVMRPNKKTVEESISANETSISEIEKNVTNGQKHKLTQENGYPTIITNQDINNIRKTGLYGGSGLVNAPNGEYAYLEVVAYDSNWCNQIFTQITNKEMQWIRTYSSGSWQPWLRLRNGQNHKLTHDNGCSFDYSNQDLNNLCTVNGFYKGSNMVNMPPVQHNWCYIEVIVHDPGMWAIQNAIDLHNPEKRWTRHMSSGIWQPWRSL